MPPDSRLAHVKAAVFEPPRDDFRSLRLKSAGAYCVEMCTYCQVRMYEAGKAQDRSHIAASCIAVDDED